MHGSCGAVFGSQSRKKKNHSATQLGGSGGRRYRRAENREGKKKKKEKEGGEVKATCSIMTESAASKSLEGKREGGKEYAGQEPREPEKMAMTMVRARRHAFCRV